MLARRRLLISLTIIISLAAILLIGWSREKQSLRDYQPVLANVNYVGSQQCQQCHVEQYNHWFESHHRKMTQEATPASIVGDFQDTSYTFLGVTSRMYRRGDEFYIYTLDLNGEKMAEAKIARTVGSRRFQQYLTQVGDTYYRLPIAYNIEKKHWFNLQGLFLKPDSANFHQHTSIWNNNCVFCHNVKANPGLSFESRRFSTKVAELGIGCEACHGPGQLHIEKNQSWLWSNLRPRVRHDDPTIVNPLRLNKLQELQVCGHCHGQRVPRQSEAIKEILSTGDPYTPGEELFRYYQPVDRQTRIGDYEFADRFYPDGTPRLTAYEFQGVMMSACYQRGEMTCNRCHSVHRGKQQSLLTDYMRSNKSCTQCHEAIAKDISAHTHHRADSSGSSCYECHRPRIAYGLLTAKRTHRILLPDINKTLTTQMPNGCNLCHKEQSAQWSAQYLSKWYGDKYRLTAENQQLLGTNSSELVRELFSYDPSARIAAAWALGQPGADANSQAGKWAIPFLIEALRDNYPAVRYFAIQSLTTLSQQDFGYFYMADPVVREASIARFEGWWRTQAGKMLNSTPSPLPLDHNGLLDRKFIASLRARPSLSIDIGE
ncbi:MAG: HEAT repeat domain-containing protein [Acidobacteriota bacterium]